MPKAKKRRYGFWFWLILFLILVAGRDGRPIIISTRAEGRRRPARRRPLPRAAIIPRAPATRSASCPPRTKGDVGVYLVGLGAVTPYNTVTIQARVSGQLMAVNFTDGQSVKKGDKLIQIDAPAYKAQRAVPGAEGA